MNMPLKANDEFTVNESVISIDPILDAIQNYRAGLADYNANVTAETEDTYHNDSYGPPMAILDNWRLPAVTPDGAIEALKLAAEECKDFATSPLINAMIHAALAYMEKAKESKSEGTSVSDLFDLKDAVLRKYDTPGTSGSKHGSHLYDFADFLDLQMSYMTPRTSEDAAALLATGFNYADRAHEGEDNDYRTEQDRRTYQRCHFAALKFLANEKQQGSDYFCLYMDPRLSLAETVSEFHQNEAA